MAAKGLPEFSGTQVESVVADTDIEDSKHSMPGRSADQARPHSANETLLGPQITEPEDSGVACVQCTSAVSPPATCYGSNPNLQAGDVGNTCLRDIPHCSDKVSQLNLNSWTDAAACGARVGDEVDQNPVTDKHVAYITHALEPADASHMQAQNLNKNFHGAVQFENGSAEVAGDGNGTLLTAKSTRTR